MPGDIRRDPIHWFVSSFGVLSAAVFVASGAMNGLLFWANWRLNYFLIANPSDVVMSAFVFGTMLAVVATISFGVVQTARVFNKQFDRLIDAALAHVASSQGIDLPPNMFSSRNFKFLEWSVIFCIHFILLMIGIIGLATQQGVPFWYDTGLKVAPATQVGTLECGGGKVEWLGSASAILKCGDELVVIHKLDDLRTVQRRDGLVSAAPPPPTAVPVPLTNQTPAPPRSAPAAQPVSLPSEPESSPTTQRPAPEAPR